MRIEYYHRPYLRRPDPLRFEVHPDAVLIAWRLHSWWITGTWNERLYGWFAKRASARDEKNARARDTRA